MALTMEGLRKLVDAEGLHYFLAPDRPALMLNVTGVNGRYQFMIILDVDGQFLQLRTFGYRPCSADHPHLPELLKVLTQLNYRLRLVKFAWAPSDGEVVVYADTWLVDSEPTQAQFQRMIHTFFSALDMHYSRIVKTLETGKDPGAEDLMAMLGRSLGADLPPEMQKLLEELVKRGKKAGAEDKKEAGKKDEKPVEPVEKI
jgi:hypothetical protein